MLSSVPELCSDLLSDSFLFFQGLDPKLSGVRNVLGGCETVQIAEAHRKQRFFLHRGVFLDRLAQESFELQSAVGADQLKILGEPEDKVFFPCAVFGLKAVIMILFLGDKLI